MGINTSMNAYLTSKLYIEGAGMRNRQVLRDISTEYCELANILLTLRIFISIIIAPGVVAVKSQHAQRWFTLVVERV